MNAHCLRADEPDSLIFLTCLVTMERKEICLILMRDCLSLLSSSTLFVFGTYTKDLVTLGATDTGLDSSITLEGCLGIFVDTPDSIFP